jgi:hypothetical protein
VDGSAWCRSPSTRSGRYRQGPANSADSEFNLQKCVCACINNIFNARQLPDPTDHFSPLPGLLQPHPQTRVCLKYVPNAQGTTGCLKSWSHFQNWCSYTSVLLHNSRSNKTQNANCTINFRHLVWRMRTSWRWCRLDLLGSTVAWTWRH